MVELLTAEEAAEIFKVSTGTIRAWVSRNKFPEDVIFKFPGKKQTCMRFIKSKLEDWIINGCLQTE